MRKLLFFLTPLLVITILYLSITLVLNQDNGRGALQVTSLPSSQIFIDGKYVGNSPFCLCEVNKLLKVGDYQVKLVPLQKGFQTYEQKVSIHKGILTVVDRTFDAKVAGSSGSVITLSELEDPRGAEVLVISVPDKADVVMDSKLSGKTPLLLKNITISDHEIKILKDGYKEKVLRLKTVEGKRLEATVYLGIRTDITIQAPVVASSSGKATILDTPTGYLRVRSEASTTADQIATVFPGEKYEIINEKEDWYQIRLRDQRAGWISKTYARKD